MAKRVREILGVAIMVVTVALVLHFTHIGCPVKFATGISCPGCGMTRAWLSAFAGDLDGAFAFHPLFWTVPVAFALLLMRNLMPKRLVSIGAATLVAALLVVWAVRLGTSITSDTKGGENAVGIDVPAWVTGLNALTGNA